MIMNSDKAENKAPARKPGIKKPQKAIEEKRDAFPNYPVYSPEEDIYLKNKKEDLNPEDISRIKVSIQDTGEPQELDLSEELSGGDLDVPGSELDDELEDIGSEDEENNYYSLGSDDHNDLDEEDGT
jgi:hypothetical protein